MFLNVPKCKIITADRIREAPPRFPPSLHHVGAMADAAPPRQRTRLHVALGVGGTADRFVPKAPPQPSPKGEGDLRGEG